jgi:hypothetical protein
VEVLVVKRENLIWKQVVVAVVDYLANQKMRAETFSYQLRVVEEGTKLVEGYLGLKGEVEVAVEMLEVVVAAYLVLKSSEVIS